MNWNTDNVLSKEQMHKVGRLNPYLRDRCGVPFQVSFRMAMLIVSNWDEIKDRVEGLPAANPRSRLIDLYVKDKQSGKVHRIGDDHHDQLTYNERGQICYHNLQNGDGCRTGDDGLRAGYEFVMNEDDHGYNMDPREQEDGGLT